MAVNDGREVWTGSFDRTIKVTDRRATARSPKEVRKPLCLPLPLGIHTARATSLRR